MIPATDYLHMENDEEVVHLKLLAEKEKEEFKWCVKCGYPFVTCRNYKSDECVSCSGILESYDKEKQRRWMRDYMSHKTKSPIDRRRKEFKCQQDHIASADSLPAEE